MNSTMVSGSPSKITDSSNHKEAKQSFAVKVEQGDEPTITIGLVDDNKDDARFFERLLKGCRAFHLKRIDYYNSGEICLEKLAYSNDIDVIIMDYHLGKGKISGVECTRKLKASDRTKHIRILILTNEEYTPEQIIEALEAGATAFVRKSIDKFSLENVIRDAYYNRWTTYTSVITDLIEYMKNLYRVKTKAIPNAPRISPLQYDIIKKIIEGKSNEEIVAELKNKYDKYYDEETNTLKAFSLDALKRKILPQLYHRFGIDTENDHQSRTKLSAKALHYKVILPSEIEV